MYGRAGHGFFQRQVLRKKRQFTPLCQKYLSKLSREAQLCDPFTRGTILMMESGTNFIHPGIP